MPTKPRITAEECDKLAGHMSWLDSIDKQIEKAARDGKRICFLQLDQLYRLEKTQLSDILGDLNSRGFNVENEVNPRGIKVLW